MICICGLEAKNGKRMKDIIEKFYTGTFVFADIDSNKWGRGDVNEVQCISYSKAVLLYNKGEIKYFFISPEYFYKTRHSIYCQLTTMGVQSDDIYLPPPGGGIFDENTTLTEHDFYSRYREAKQLDYLQIRINYHCNLNCKGCGALAPLETSPVFADYEGLKNDLFQLRKFFDYIDVIRVLGGEPLLNKDLDSYLKLLRQLWPKSPIVVVTNALLLDKMPETFYELIKENNIKITISLYKPLWNKIDEMAADLKEKGISFDVENSYKFHKSYDFKGTVDSEYNSAICPYRCPTLENGRLCRCPINPERINKFFSTDLPLDGDVDIYEEGLTTEKIRQQLNLPKPQCRYCSFVDFYKWDYSSRDLTEWIVSSN